MNRIAKEDLSHILIHTKELWNKHFKNGSTIFITGGTGFFGKWLLDSFLHINEELNLEGTAIVLSRNPNQFLSNFPQFKSPSIQFTKGDISNFTYPNEQIDFIIHAATESSVWLNLAKPLLMYDTIVDGTKNVLNLAKEKKVKALLYVSSGAIYGKQPSEISHLTEDYYGCPDIYSPDAAYGEGKRVAEMLCNIYFKKHQVPSKIARCFAFAGPYLPLDGPFAFGNFTKNVIDGKNIHINSDGTPIRSYMYPSDLSIWLWTILFIAQPCRAYNVGSEDEISIEDLANKFKSFLGKGNNIHVSLPKTGKKPLRYVPSVKRAIEELSLNQKISLEEAIYKTILFYKSESI